MYFEHKQTIIIEIDENRPQVPQVLEKLQEVLNKLSIIEKPNTIFKVNVLVKCLKWIFKERNQFFFSLSLRRIVGNGGKIKLLIEDINHEEMEKNLAKVGPNKMKCLENFCRLYQQPYPRQIEVWQQIEQALITLMGVLQKNLSKLKEQHEFAYRCVRQLYQKNSADQNSQIKIQFSQNADRIYADYYFLYNFIDEYVGNGRQQDKWWKMKDNNFNTEASRKKQLKRSASLLRYFIQKFTTVSFKNNQECSGLPTEAGWLIIQKANQLMDILMEISKPQIENDIFMEISKPQIENDIFMEISKSQMENVPSNFAERLSEFKLYFKKAKEVIKTSKSCGEQFQRLQSTLKNLTNMQIHKFVPGTHISQQHKNYGQKFIKLIFNCIFGYFHFSQINKALLNQVTAFLKNPMQRILYIINTVFSVFLQILYRMQNVDLYSYIQNKAHQQSFSHSLHKSSQILKLFTMDLTSFISSYQLNPSIQLQETDKMIKICNELLKLLEKLRQEQIQGNMVFNVFASRFYQIKKYMREIEGYLEQIKSKIQILIVRVN